MFRFLHGNFLTFIAMFLLPIFRQGSRRLVVSAFVGIQQTTRRRFVVSSKNSFMPLNGAKVPSFASSKIRLFLSTDNDSEKASPYLEDLNNAQVEAVTQPLKSVTRVVAGPGAGKTRVLTTRIVHILHNDERNRILAVTFTKKAAGEMQDRLQAMLLKQQQQNQSMPFLEEDGYIQDDEAPSAIPMGLERVTLGTFHSICAKILRWNGKELLGIPSIVESTKRSKTAANLDGSFTILDQSDQLRIIKLLLKNAGIDLSKEKLKVHTKPLTIINNISRIKMGTTKEVKNDRGMRIAKKIFPDYREYLLAMNALDFDDLMALTKELLESREDIREALQKRWPYVLVDEFQDTSLVQMEIVRLLTTESLLVVGDADQSIYSWRGANVESMADFDSSFRDTKTVYLMENYRSTSDIVEAAQRVIRTSKSKTAKNLRQDMIPMRGTGAVPRVLACQNTNAESKFVVKTIQSKVDKKQLGPDKTVAVLYRTNAQSRSIEEACVKFGLPYVVRGSVGTFYSRIEIKDCLCFLRWVYNGRDEAALLRAFRTPSRGIGGKSIAAFQEYCKEVNEIYSSKYPNLERPSALELLRASADKSIELAPDLPPLSDYFPKRTMNRVVPFAEKMNSLHAAAQSMSMFDFTTFVIETMELKEHLDSISKSMAEFEDRWANLQELRQAAKKHGDRPATAVGENGETPLESFLDDIALVTDIAVDESQEAEEDGIIKPKSIKANLMTIHAAKGMEFNVVFLIGNEDGTFPTSQAVSEGEYSVELDEERRLCYVAMTRAKDELIMTWRREAAVLVNDDIRTLRRDRSRFLDVLMRVQRPSDVRPLEGKAPDDDDDEGTKGQKPPLDRPRFLNDVPLSTYAKKLPGLVYPEQVSPQALKDLQELFPPEHRELVYQIPPEDLGLVKHMQSTHKARSKKMSYMDELERATSEEKFHRGTKKKSFRKGVGKYDRRNVPGVHYTMYENNRGKRVLMDGHPDKVVNDVAKKFNTTEYFINWCEWYKEGTPVIHFDHGRGEVLSCTPPTSDGEDTCVVNVRFDSGKEVEVPGMAKEMVPNFDIMEDDDSIDDEVLEYMPDHIQVPVGWHLLDDYFLQDDGSEL